MEGWLGTAFRLAVQPNRRNQLHWASWAVALAIQVGFVLLLGESGIFHWEVTVTRWLQDIPGRHEFFDVSHFLTNTIAWEFIPIFLAAFIAMWVFADRVGALLLVLAFPLHVLAQWPKAVIDRPRPPAGYADVDGVGGLQSFPSGHAEFVITFWGFILFVAFIHVESRAVRAVATVAWLGLVISTGVGRIATGRHWPLDILVSYVVGVGLLSGLVWLHTAIHASLKRTRTEVPSRAP